MLLVNYADQLHIIPPLGAHGTLRELQILAYIDTGFFTKASTLDALAAGAPLSWALEWENSNDE